MHGSVSPGRSNGTDFMQHYAQVRDSGPAWIRKMREASFRAFESIGYPDKKNEDWKHTSVDPVAATTFHFPGAVAGYWSGEMMNSVHVPSVGESKLVFVNGLFAPHLSDLPQVSGRSFIGSLSELLDDGSDEPKRWLGSVVMPQGSPFAALNTALMRDAAVIILQDGTVLSEPLQVIHLTSADARPVAVHPRCLVVCGSGCRISLVETFGGTGNGDRYMANAVTEIILGDNSEIDHIRVQSECKDAYHLGRLDVRQGRDSRFNSFNMAIGAALSRLDINTVLGGRGAEALLNGLYLTDGDRHSDHHTSVDHAVPHCVSRELYRGVLSDSATAVFNGRITVRQGSDGTDAGLANNNLLLSDDATIHARPQLEIYNDDVRCTHGATIGRIYEEALFYARSRGIPENDARLMLINAFTAGVLDRLQLPELREDLAGELHGRLSSAFDRMN